MKIVIDISEYDKEWIGNAYGIPQDINTKIAEAIINAEPCQPEPHWIPVTEEPIPDGEYLVTWTSEIQEKPILSIICRYSGVWDCWELQLLGHQDINVLAYMELPEPYKGVTE